MIDFLSGRKTYILMGLGIVKVLLLTITGDMSAGEFLESAEIKELFVYIAGMTFRAGMAKKV